MPNDSNSNEPGALLPGAERPDREQCRIELEAIVERASSIIFYNWRFGHAGFEEANTLARALMKDKGKVFIMAMDEIYFEDLYISVPFDVEQAFKGGRPIVVAPIGREPRSPNPTNRPVDTPLIQQAKVALHLTALRLRAAQKAVELWRGLMSRRKSVTPVQASENATKKLVGLDPSDIEVLDNHPRLRWFAGLIDRALRQAADFFNVAAPRHVERHFADRARTRLKGGANADVMETDHVAELRTFEMHEERAVAREGAMHRWSRNVEAERPIDASDMRAIANAHPERQSARALMRVAIEGTINPADVQGHSLSMTDAFEAGRKVGLVLRGQYVVLTVTDAGHIRKAITIASRQIIETDEDGAYFYLADALARFREPFEWLRIADDVLASQTSAMVSLGDDLT